MATEFTNATKTLLAERAGHRCSFPDCDRVTVGPNQERETAVSKTGMACHIYAANDGPAARRAHSIRDPEVLSSPENGIWMCYTHGKLIDTDEATYTPELLKFWRHLAEWRANIRLQYGENIIIPKNISAGDKFPTLSAQIDATVKSLDGMHELFKNSCLAHIWDRDLVNCVREFIAEMTLNAIEHGGSDRVSLTLNWDSVTLRSTGRDFSPFDLANRANGRGGSASIKALLEKLGKIVLVHTYDEKNNENETTVGFLSDIYAISDFTHCHLTVAKDADQRAITKKARDFCADNPDCKVVYIVMSNFIYSTAMKIKETIPNISKDQQIVLLTGEISESLRQYLESEMPNIRIGSLPT